MGHEAAHILARHPNERVSQQLAVQGMVVDPKGRHYVERILAGARRMDALIENDMKRFAGAMARAARVLDRWAGGLHESEASGGPWTRLGAVQGV